MQLAQVGHAGVGREVRLAVDHPLQLALRLAVAAELDERVDEHRRRAAAPGGVRAPPEHEPAAEVVAREREHAGGHERVGVVRVRAQRRGEDPAGARVEAGIAGLAHALEIGRGERDAQVGAVGRGADGALQSGDVGRRAGQHRLDERRAAHGVRGLLAAAGEQREHGEARAEGEQGR